MRNLPLFISGDVNLGGLALKQILELCKMNFRVQHGSGKWQGRKSGHLKGLNFTVNEEPLKIFKLGNIYLALGRKLIQQRGR